MNNFTIDEQTVNMLKERMVEVLNKDKNKAKIREKFLACVKAADRGVSEVEVGIYQLDLNATIVDIFETIEEKDLQLSTVDDDGEEYTVGGRMDGDIFICMEYKGKLWHSILSMDVLKPLGFDIIQYDIDGDSGVFSVEIPVEKDAFGININYLELWGEEDYEDEEDFSDMDLDEFIDDDDDRFGYLN